MSGEQASASSSGASGPRAKKTKSARNLRAAKKNAKLGKATTQDSNQARLMQVFDKLALGYDAVTTAKDMGIDSANIRPSSAPIDIPGATEPPIEDASDIEPQTENACANPDKVQAYFNEQREDDDDGEEAAAPLCKPKHRRRKNRKGKDAKSTEDAQRMVQKKEVGKTEARPAGQAKQSLTYSHVLPEGNRKPKLKITPESHYDCDAESDYEDYWSENYDSDDDRWDVGYEDQDEDLTLIGFYGHTI